MGDNKPGKDSLESLEGCSDWYFVQEAECISLDSIHGDLEELFDNSTSSDISNLIDNCEEVDQGNSLELFNKQVTEDCNKALLNLKRKYLSPSPKKSICADRDLSPRLLAVSISAKKSSKRQLFQDSGIEENEAEDFLEEQVEYGLGCNNGAGKSGGNRLLDLLRSNNRRAVLLAKFKDLYGISFHELIRPFKNDKSICDNWVVIVYAAADEVIEGSKVLLEQHCDYFLIKHYDFMCLYLVSFHTGKCRDTVQKLFRSMLNVEDAQLVCDPPKHRSTATALYFYKCSIGNAAYMFGELPNWISKLVLVEHQAAATSDSFDFSEMVQWAYDHNYIEESRIAYEYAVLAQTDSNAAAWLNHNNQVKYVKDCAYMCKLYKRQEMKDMSMSQWIWKCCNKIEAEGDWKVIPQFLKFQGVNFISFLTAFKPFLKCTPKKNCILFHGDPDTGKSYFVYSLITFLQGKVISIMNSKSQFWLQPLSEGKIGLIDDVTYTGWQYIDVHMRTGLDGNMISVDLKHKAPQQMKLPPLLVTSNINVHKEMSLVYLHSRINAFEFTKKLPIDDNGEPVYKITDVTWKYFFIKLAKHLDLSPEDEGNGETERTLRCSARSSADAL
ncbi:E1 protein [Human papillomavirus type 221]|uniref:Replication protein E1 n=1 Tax=Human papillomavirus type 221 TaxID=2200958 RepID=A0A2S1ZRY1_9PAPI|nr:E1 protein [Human papillomavirus type 221]